VGVRLDLLSSGRIRFFSNDEQEQSQLAPDMPNHL
jgi:hypothetical protein